MKFEVSSAVKFIRKNVTLAGVVVDIDENFLWVAVLGHRNTFQVKRDEVAPLHGDLQPIPKPPTQSGGS